MALDDINDNNSGILTNYKLTAKIMDGECKPSTVMKKFIDIIMNDKVMRDFIGILGENFTLLRSSIGSHYSEIRCLCLMKCPSKMLENLPYF